MGSEPRSEQWQRQDCGKHQQREQHALSVTLALQCEITWAEDDVKFVPVVPLAGGRWTNAASHLHGVVESGRPRRRATNHQNDGEQLTHQWAFSGGAPWGSTLAKVENSCRASSGSRSADRDCRTRAPFRGARRRFLILIDTDPHLVC